MKGSLFVCWFVVVYYIKVPMKAVEDMNNFTSHNYLLHITLFMLSST